MFSKQKVFFPVKVFGEKAVWGGVTCGATNEAEHALYYFNGATVIQGFSGPLSQKSDENRRMRAFWREF